MSEQLNPNVNIENDLRMRLDTCERERRALLELMLQREHAAIQTMERMQALVAKLIELGPLVFQATGPERKH